MLTDTGSSPIPARPAARAYRSAVPLARLALLLAATGLCSAGYAIDFGPFSLTGFAKFEATRGSNNCSTCQYVAGEDKQRQWADYVVPGTAFGTANTHVSLMQPWLGAKFDLGNGFKLSGLLSQRWRDGQQDIAGFWYEKNVALSHEDYGSLRIGAMTTRAWSMADYPYGSNVNVADQWGASGAGYGLLGHAARYTSRPLDVLEGDLVLEATYDYGNRNFTVNKPRFWELYAQYHRGALVIDAMFQDTRNGTPMAWGHGPFSGLTPFPADDAKLGPSGQSMAMAMARYQVDTQWEVSGGVRRNRWSGAYAVITQAGPPDLWNSMFNVDWGGQVLVTENGKLRSITNPGYPATSTDLLLGLRYRWDKWTASTGMVHLGKASTQNPSERGQSNSALFNTIGLTYDYGQGLQLYGFAGTVHYDHIGLSPMSMPGNAAFTNVDSRVTTTGNWLGAGAVFVF